MGLEAREKEPPLCGGTDLATLLSVVTQDVENVPNNYCASAKEISRGNIGRILHILAACEKMGLGGDGMKTMYLVFQQSEHEM